MPHVASDQPDAVDSDSIVQIKAYLDDLTHRTKCWVCGATNWLLTESTESFGVIVPALARSLMSPSSQEMSQATLICRVCATVWPLSIPMIQMKIDEKAQGNDDEQ